MSADTETIIKQMEWARKRGLLKLTMTLGDMTVHLERAQHAADESGPPLAPSATKATGEHDDAPAPDTQVAAPLSGLCHLASEENSTPFVAVGDQVSAGQTLCVIEAMKVMTSVTAPKAGRVTAILVTNGASVNANDLLFEVEP